MKERLLYDRKITLTKEQQLKILKFFVKTSIPRMLQTDQSKREVK